MRVGLAAAAPLLLAHGAGAARRALAGPAPPRPPRPDTGSPPFLEEADALARRGLFLEAARRVQLAALDLLLRARVLELGRSDPNRDRKSTRLNSSHGYISYAVFCLKKKKTKTKTRPM